MQIYSKNKQVKRILAGILTVIMVLVSIDLGQLVSVQAATEYDTLYLIDNTAEKWVKNDNAKIKAIDNSNGHTAYWMTQKDETTWSVKIPKNAYNITFNRYAEDKTTQWNSWSAGGRDKNNAYYVDGSEYGHWEIMEESKEYFQTGDMIYLDVSEFPKWIDEVNGTKLYVNFTSAMKEENTEKDIDISTANKEKYNPYAGLKKESDSIYSYTVTEDNAGSDVLRFWRGNDDTLWNCSICISAGDMIEGNNCIKVTNWNNTGYLCSYVNDIDMNLKIENCEYDDKHDVFIIKEKIKKIVATLSTTAGVSSLKYELRDCKDILLSTKEIPIKENFEIDNLGMTIGSNQLIFYIETDDKKVIEKKYELWNYSIDNTENLNLDLEDDDNDGLANYYEDYFGTQKDNVDSDGDGLSDYIEVMGIGTSPILQDTNENGITDDLEDKDNDGLCNIEEVKIGTLPNYEDSDRDGLTDGEEVNIYNTNPLKKDTDGDGINDGDEIKLGLNPNVKDTDGDGILDSEEKIEQTIKEKIEDDSGELVSISVKMSLKGVVDDSVTICDTSETDVKSAGVCGIVGVPIEIECTQEFESAEITFEYDEKMLGETSEKDLCMMWYNEEDDTYVLLEDSKVDTEKNIVTYTTTHFSTYLVVDRQIWYDTWREDINYRESGNVLNYDIALVVDVSGSMSGRPLSTAKTALNTFVEAMLTGDRCALIKFNSTASIVQWLTSEQSIIKTAISSLYASGGTSASAGLTSGLNTLTASVSDNEKMMILICDGAVSYNPSIVQKAIDNNIRIHCLNVTSASAENMKRIAEETGGTYYLAATTEDIISKISDLSDRTISSIDITDSDGDGLYDVYEVNGVRISNGQIVYTDSNNSDSDGDGISDYDELGGLPTSESVYLDGDLYSCTINHMKSDPLKKDGDGDGIIDSLDPEPEKHFGEIKTGKYYQIADTIRIPHNSAIDAAANVTEQQYAKIWQERYAEEHDNEYQQAMYILSIKARAYAMLLAAGLGNIFLKIGDILPGKAVNINDGVYFLAYYLDKNGGIVEYDASRIVEEDPEGIQRYNLLTNDILRVCEQAVCKGNTIRFEPIDTAEKYFGCNFSPDGLSTLNYWLAIKGGSMGLTGTCYYDGISYDLDLYFCVQDFYDFYYEDPEGGADSVGPASNDEMAFLKYFDEAETFENCGVYYVKISWKKGQDLSQAKQIPFGFVPLFE